MAFDYFGYIILPLLIVIARISDVSIGTIRMIFVSKGLKKVATVLGFFEILIWIIAISKIMERADHWIYYVFYAGGFALGTYIGMCIEEKLSVGKTLVRVITQKDATNLIEELKEKNYRVTIADAKGKSGNVKIIFTVINKKKLKKVISMIHEFNPKAFYTVEDVKHVNDFSEEKHSNKRFLFRFYRKGK